MRHCLSNPLVPLVWSVDFKNYHIVSELYIQEKDEWQLSGDNQNQNFQQKLSVGCYLNLQRKDINTRFITTAIKAVHMFIILFHCLTQNVSNWFL